MESNIVAPVAARQESNTGPAQLRHIAELFDGECVTISDLTQVGAPIVHASDAFVRLTGYGAHEACGRGLGFLQHSDTEQPGNRTLRDALGRGEPCTVILRNYRKDGSLFWNEQRHYPVRDEAGEVSHVVSVQRDVTARINAAMSQDVGEAMARYLQEEGRFFGYSLLLRHDRPPSVAWVSAAVQHLVGASPDEVVRDGIASILHRDDREVFARRLGRIRRSIERAGEARAGDDRERDRIFRDQYRLVDRDGRVLWVEDAASIAWRSPEAGVIALHSVVRDITALRKSQNEFWQLSHFDILTGLPNRNLLHDRLQQAFGHARRNRRWAGAVMVDLDAFRVLDQTAGSRDADRVLQSLAERLRRAVRRSDTLARYEGDTFVLLLPDLRTPEDLAIVVEKLSYAIQGPHRIGGRSHELTASMGAALASAAEDTPDDLLARAQQALKRAKARGAGSFSLDEEGIAPELARSIRRQGELRQAVERDQLVVHYQPRVRLATGEITAVEALVRWLHPEEGLLKPREFLTEVRSADAARRVFHWVLDRACRQAAAWVAERTPRRVAVNVPEPVLADPAFPDGIAEALARHDVHPALVEVELMGALSAEALTEHAGKLARLRAMGVRVSLDDFGSRAMSFADLRALPVDGIKIDGAFVRDLADGGARCTKGVVGSIMALARSLALDVVAEGVETSAQAHALHELACEEAQGYLYSHPVPAEHVGGRHVRLAPARA